MFQSRSTANYTVDRCRHTLECPEKSKADTNADTAHIVTARFDWSERRDLNSGPLAPHGRVLEDLIPSSSGPFRGVSA